MTKLKTDIRDADLARAALRALGASVHVHGTIVTATVGETEIAIDLSTGRVDTADDSIVSKLRQLYSEMLVRHHLEAQGGVIEAREVRPNGDIVLVCSVL